MNPDPSTQPVLFGEVLFDCFDDGSRILGGAPFNVAWHLQGFGLRPILISRVGDDPLGHQIRRRMIDWGMSSAGLQLDSRYPTGEVQVRIQNGQPSYDIVSDRAWDHIEARALPPLRPGLLYHGSLGLRSDDSAACFARLSQDCPVPRYFDVNLRSPWWQAEQVLQLIGQAHWLKINDEELNSLVSQGADLEQKASALLQDNGLRWIIVTQGAAGAFALDAEGHFSQVRPEADIQVVDTVGAGDAFAAVSLLGLTRHWPAELILQRAQQFASLIVGQRGATAADPQLYSCLHKTWEL
ncbi:MAG: carbohydrate kinase [Gammaproteobacteria bacterium SHHR-1]|uniref:carbohydrate kinase family protein n=1 Tax=Magnetovirga frankeli TaxID=947516 RepID=UPI0012938F08|nr:carbohydrate kinase [gamma proteobacterium SS-5]